MIYTFLRCPNIDEKEKLLTDIAFVLGGERLDPRRATPTGDSNNNSKISHPLRQEEIRQTHLACLNFSPVLVYFVFFRVHQVAAAVALLKESETWDKEFQARALVSACAPRCADGRTVLQRGGGVGGAALQRLFRMSYKSHALTPAH